MSLVETTCPQCRELVLVAVNEVRGWNSGGHAYIAFACPRCDSPAAKRCHPEHLEDLARLGAAIDAAGLRPPLHPEHIPDPDAPRFVADDVLALHELLARDDWFEQLLGLTN